MLYALYDLKPLLQIGVKKMRKELTFQNATFVYSKGEFAYAPLLEEMKTAKEWNHTMKT